MKRAEATRFELIRAATGDDPAGPDDPPVPVGGNHPGEIDATRLTALVQSVQAGVLMEDEHSRIVLANRAFCDLFDLDEAPDALIGWEAAMVIGALRERFADPSELLSRTAVLVAARREALSEEIRLTDGRALERDYVPIFDGDHYQGHFWIFRDITSHVRTKEALRRSGDRLRVLSGITARLDPVGEEGLVEGLAGVTELLGLDFGLVLRFDGDEYVVEQAWPAAGGGLRAGDRGLLDALRAGGALAVGGGVVATAPAASEDDFLCTLADGVRPATLLGGGVEAPGCCRGQVLFGGLRPREHVWSSEDRELVRLFARWVEKSLDRRRAEMALRRSEERYRDFVENTAALVCIHDLEGVILEVNRPVVETLGLKGPEEVEGHSLSEFLHPDEKDRFSEYLETLARKGQVRGTMTVVAADGQARVLSFDNSVRRDGVDRPVVRGLGQDTTERHRAEEALRQRVELEQVLVDLSTGFINLPPSEVDRTIERTLGELGRALRVDRGAVYLLDETRRNLVRSHAWSASGEVPAAIPAQMRVADLPRLMQAVSRLEPVRIDSVADLPPAADDERRQLEASGVRSLLAVPVTSRGELLGSVDLATTSEEVRWRDEAVSVLRVIGNIIGSALDRKSSEEALSRAHRELERSNRELAWNNRMMAVLGEMGDLLQTSSDTDEARRVIRDLAPGACPAASGAVYLFESSGSALTPVVTWGDAEGLHEPIGDGSCWALRRGRPYRVDPSVHGPLCRHVPEGTSSGTLCIPLLAQGEGLGILHLRDLVGAGPEGWSPGAEQLALNAAEHMALGLSNLALRERLELQALRDPLTGLLNRRSLEQECEREAARARREGTSLGLLMLDLDHFKRINDTYGHDVGDRVLVEVADLLRSSVREDDVVARFGGEELTVLMAGACRETATAVAETLRRRIEDLRVPVRGHWIEDLTVSIGVASLPECSSSLDGLLTAADEALYDAKGAGRNRVVTAPISVVTSQAATAPDSIRSRPEAG